MSKTLLVPDIHLKTYMFERIEQTVIKHNVDKIVFLGDYFDEWDCNTNAQLYFETCALLKEFKQKYKCVFLLGNHDVPYITGAYHHYSTPLHDVRREINKTLNELEPVMAYKEGNILISHAGYIKEPNNMNFNNVIRTQYGMHQLRHFDQSDLSPLWIRPDTLQFKEECQTPIQIVGHTPVLEPEWYETDNGHQFLVIDTWSKTPTGEVYGNEKLVLITDQTQIDII